MNSIYRFLALIISIGYLTSGCTDFQSKVDFNKKQQSLETHQVFTDDEGNSETFDSGDQTENTDGGTTNTNPPVLQPPAVTPPIVNASPFSVPITNICSDRQLSKLGVSVMTADQLKVEIVKNGQSLCSLTNTSSLRSQISSHKLQIPQSCSQFVNSSDVTNSQNSPAQLKILGKKGGSWKMLNYASAPFQVLFDEGSRVPFIGDLFINKNCDRRASPLFIDLRDNDKKGGDYLSSIENGVFFNILGYKAKEFGKMYGKNIANNTPMKISWFKKPQFKLLTLPNAQGKIQGIDQLFGDNTLGPDASFGKDSEFKQGEKSGYAALIKFDGLQNIEGLAISPRSIEELKSKRALFLQYKKEAKERDSMIDREDAVYHALRLWGDINGDGIAQKNELTSLLEEKIIAIDLVYDRNGKFLETDKHGNQIKFKSIVIRCTDERSRCESFMKGDMPVDYQAITEGSLKTEQKIIFDVWFKILPDSEIKSL